MSCLRQKYCESVGVSIELEVVSDELIDNHILVGELRLGGWIIVESVENLCADSGSNLGEDTPFFEGLLEHVLKFVDARHLNIIMNILHKETRASA